MLKLKKPIITNQQVVPNPWDLAGLLLVFVAFGVLAWGAMQMTTPFKLGEQIAISLDPSNLPHYALRTVLRMLIALVFSLLCTFIFGTWAAKSWRAEQIIIPLIDILQSVPVLGFLAISVVAFIVVFPGSLLGPECACIFAIFTSQAWNMILSFYQSNRTIPLDLQEAADSFQLSTWQRFWRIEVPFAMPGLLWNTMMSMSASWFFVVASEAIVVSNQDIYLPGIGSYIATALNESNLQAVGYAICAMLLVILCYDQLIFRPLQKWSEKFSPEEIPFEAEAKSWVITLFQRTRILRYLGYFLSSLGNTIVNFNILNRTKVKATNVQKAYINTIINISWYLLLLILIGFSSYLLHNFISKTVSSSEFLYVFGLGIRTALRVIVSIVFSSVVWIPIGIWIGRRPRYTHIAQPIVQFLAAFPANLFFPLFVYIIVKYQLNVEIWTTPLMILGCQWYILFNIIAGASAIPKELYQVTDNFGVSGWQRWKQFIIPGIFPYFITGTITAAGAAWNISILAEVVQWGQIRLDATGLGSYITKSANSGDFPRLALGIAVMCLFVLVLNRVLWRPLYILAENRYRMD